MRVGDVCMAMEEWSPPGLAYSWDRVGLQIGDPESKVASVMVALSVTREAFEAACRERAQMIATHHRQQLRRR